MGFILKVFLVEVGLILDGLGLIASFLFFVLSLTSKFTSAVISVEVSVVISDISKS